MNEQAKQLAEAVRFFLESYASTKKGLLKPPKDGWTHFQTAAYVADKALCDFEGKQSEWPRLPYITP